MLSPDNVKPKRMFYLILLQKSRLYISPCQNLLSQLLHSFTHHLCYLFLARFCSTQLLVLLNKSVCKSHISLCISSLTSQALCYPSPKYVHSNHWILSSWNHDNCNSIIIYVIVGLVAIFSDTLQTQIGQEMYLFAIICISYAVLRNSTNDY